MSVYQSAVIRQCIASDVPMSQEDDPIRNRVVLVSFNDLHKGPLGTHNDTQMVGPAGVFSLLFHIPVIEDQVAGQGNTAVIFFPATDLSEQFNLPFAAATVRDWWS
jgi:hypothetical protein